MIPDPRLGAWKDAGVGIPSIIAVALAGPAPPNPAGSGLTTALVGVAGLLLGSLIAGGFRLAGDKEARRADSQRAALYALQDGASSLRKQLRSYGRGLPHPSQEVTDALDDTNGRFDLLIDRVLCSQVQEQARAWREVAEPYWTGDADVGMSTENDAWLLLSKFVGQEIRRLDD